MTDDTQQPQAFVTAPGWAWAAWFDAPPAVGPPGLGAADVLDLFRAWHDVGPGDRRESPRYAPAETRAWVGWWRGDRFSVHRAELVNLSRGGALVRLAEHPPKVQPVWLCLGAPRPVDQVQARVLDVSAGPADGLDARVEFHGPCPAGFFLAAGQRDGRLPA